MSNASRCIEMCGFRACDSCLHNHSQGNFSDTLTYGDYEGEDFDSPVILSPSSSIHGWRHLRRGGWQSLSVKTKLGAPYVGFTCGLLGCSFFPSFPFVPVSDLVPHNVY